MARLEITGGWTLRGQVRISGAKNATLPMLAAALLTGEECALVDAPRLRDTAVMEAILTSLGVAVHSETDGEGRRVLVARAGSLEAWHVPERLVGEMRSSIFIMGPLLGRLRRARISYPGGCAIGPRPIDMHLRGLTQLGAVIRERGGYIEAETPGLVGAEIHLDFPSVGATENLMMAAVLARGTTVIHNTAKEPEIVDLQNFLNKLGARIRGGGTDAIRVDGVASLGGGEHTVIPDRIEAGTYLAAVGAARGEARLENVIPEHLDAVLSKFGEAGLQIHREADALSVQCGRRLEATDFKTLPYPGYPTDLQPQATVLACTARGISMITDTIFPSRFTQVQELRRMGADIRLEGRTAVVTGVRRLSGATVSASDLRSGAALVLAGLAAEGTTVVEGIHHVDRGYEEIESKLAALGAVIQRLE
ncbi:MAG: UDP-N-acetylglucosamine 1-carboxyvinyltransferase [bacterium]|nr:UDP-N-acetylglucosamine 1-carboxyvinyltransferase [bacterium]